MTPASRRLASRAGIRQVDTVLRADAAADAADLAVARLWNQVLTVLKMHTDRRDPARAYHAIAEILRQLPIAARASIGQSLDRMAQWGHKSASTQIVKALPQDALAYAAIAARVTEAVTAKEMFPPQTSDEVSQIVYSSGWQDRFKAATKLGSPEQLASLVMQGVAQGKTHQQIAKDLLPHVNGVKKTARRVARDESYRVANETQFANYEALGDLVVGYQIHATLDQHSRPEHAARNGTIYYKSPKSGQLGLDRMPRPPLEADGKLAYGCRCYLSPVMVEPEDLAQPGADLSAFTAQDGPDPVVYGEWFAQADEQRRRLAVGTRRYSTMQKQLGERPDWEHFVDAQGKLLSIGQLKAESDEQRAARVQAVQRAQAAQRKDKVTVSTFGYLPGTDSVPAAPTPPAPTPPVVAPPPVLPHPELDPARAPLTIERDAYIGTKPQRIQAQIAPPQTHRDLDALETHYARADRATQQQIRDYLGLDRAQHATDLREQLEQRMTARLNPEPLVEVIARSEPQRQSFLAAAAALNTDTRPLEKQWDVMATDIRTQALRARNGRSKKAREEAAAERDRLQAEADRLRQRIGAIQRGDVYRDDFVRAYAAPNPATIAVTPHDPAIVPAAREAVDFLQRILPAQPITPIATYAVPGNDRAHYDHATKRINAHANTDIRTLVHEIGHAIEYSDPSIHAAAKEFLAKRVGNESFKPMTDVGTGYEAHEMGRDDDFAKAFDGDRSRGRYAGKVYADATEVISLGVDTLYADPKGFAERDPEYFNFIVGVLQGHARRKGIPQS